MKVFLIDVDSTPNTDNIAIGKYLTYYRAKGYHVNVLKLSRSAYPNNRDADIVDATPYDMVKVSLIFKRNYGMVIIEGCGDVEFGGTGHDVKSKLPEEIDNLDYTNYCNENERIEFLTRGRIRDCWFCVVRSKEGFLYEYRSLDRIINSAKGLTIRFLDNNFLAWEKSTKVLRRLVKNKTKCYFDQGLDIRMINDLNAKLLSKLKYGSDDYIFAFDNWQLVKTIDDKLSILRKHIKRDWKIKFYIFTNASQPIYEVRARVEYCKKNRVLPYIMRYDDCYTSQNHEFYVDIASWCNQPGIFKSMTFQEFLNRRHPKNKARVKKSLDLYNGGWFL